MLSFILRLSVASLGDGGLTESRSKAALDWSHGGSVHVEVKVFIGFGVCLGSLWEVTSLVAEKGHLFFQRDLEGVSQGHSSS